MFNTDFQSNTFAQYFTADFFGPEELTVNEKTISSKFSPKRLRDFSTGRFCARKALTALGYAPADILIGVNSEPLWPDGIVGSISHSGEFTGAIVGLSSNFISIGIDIETTGKINRNMWDIVYTPTEQRFLNTFTNQEQVFYTTLLFSFKESFYKMQYPITGMFLEFTDVEVSLQGNIFELTVIKEFDGKNKLPHAVPLHYLQQKTQLITLCYLINNNVTSI